MSSLNFDLFEHYRSRAAQGDGEAARDLLRLLADRVGNPEQALEQRERDTLAMILRRFADYSDDVDKERENKQRRNWTPMRVFMDDPERGLPNAKTGPQRMTRMAADYERQLQYMDAIIAFHRAANLPMPETLKEGAAKKIAAAFTKIETKAGSKGASYKTLQLSYAAFRPYLDGYMQQRDAEQAERDEAKKNAENNPA